MGICCVEGAGQRLEIRVAEKQGEASVKGTTINEVLPSFEAAGFVAFPQFVIGDELAELIANVDRFITDIVPQMQPEYTLGFIYYSERARGDTEAHAACQRKLAEEMKATGKL